MIVMIISDSPESERRKIVNTAKAQAAYKSDEKWRFVESESVQELLCHAAGEDKVDMICIDLTMVGAIPAAEELRREHSSAYLTLIADDSISPVKYIRPSIQADSLMIKPLDKTQLDEVLGEAVETYMLRLDKPSDDKVFLAESKGERNLIGYDKILFFESREKKVFLSTEKEEYGFYDTLEELEVRLDERFLRCHRSYIVNSERIARVEISAGRIKLDDGTELPLSRSYKPVIRKHLNERKENGNH